MKNKIGWCNLTWIPVWGCNNNCEYCYARGMAKRFYSTIIKSEFKHFCKIHSSWAWTGDYLEGMSKFKPIFLISQFNKKFPKKPQRIFVGSMSEIFYWDEDWMIGVLKKIKEYPQHTFIFLTKHPIVYCKYTFPGNCWLGVTITNNEDAYYLDNIYLNPNDYRTKFICIEPILSDINPYFFKKNMDWVIVGAETGSRKGKEMVMQRWITNIINGCNKYDIPIYLKDSINKLFPDIRAYKQFPKNKGGE